MTRASRQKKTMENKETQSKWRCVWRNTNIKLLSQSSQCTSIIYFKDTRYPFTSYSAAKHPKHSTFARKTSRFYILYYAGVNFNSRNTFANLGSFAKVFIPVQSIVCVYQVTVKLISRSVKSLQNRGAIMFIYFMTCCLIRWVRGLSPVITILQTRMCEFEVKCSKEFF